MAGRAEPPRYASIIIDDLGNSMDYAQQIIDLPAAVTLAILPETTYSREIANEAARRHREVMLHLPLQSIENRKASPGTLALHMTKKEFTAQLRRNIASIPHVQGLNNHMGSLLTRHPGHMDWLMSELARDDKLFFVDSRTTSKTVAARIADEHDIPNITRDVFLDPDHEAQTLTVQFNRFIRLVNKRGYGLAIAHPYPETIHFLQQHLAELEARGIRLVPVSQLIRISRKNYVTCTGPACTGL